jgi:hypothetical protein
LSKCVRRLEGVGDGEECVVVSFVLRSRRHGKELTPGRSVWHQQCRRICSTPGTFIVRDVLHIRRGSFASKYLQLFSGFFISAIVHGCAAMFVHRSFEDDAAFVCFVGQAVVILVEDHAIDLGKRLGFKDSDFWRVVGCAWTVFVIGASMQTWTSSTVGRGIWIHDRTRDVFRIGPEVVQ